MRARRIGKEHATCTSGGRGSVAGADVAQLDVGVWASRVATSYKSLNVDSGPIHVQPATAAAVAVRSQPTSQPGRTSFQISKCSSVNIYFLYPDSVLALPQ